MLGEVECKVTVGYAELERAIRALPYVRDLPRSQYGREAYSYIADRECHNDSIHEESIDLWATDEECRKYCDGLSRRELADKELREACADGNGWYLTTPALAYLAAFGLLAPEAEKFGLNVRVSW